jgi:hypothetical protein
MPDENAHLRSVLRAAPSELPSSDEELELPALNGQQYVPHARPANKPLYSIHFVNAAGGVHSFQYVHMDSYSTYTAESITLKFLGMEPVKVVIRGRNLLRLYDYLHQHRIAWIMQVARDFAQDGKTVVTHVSFTTVKAEE